VSYRSSGAFESSEFSRAAWLRWGETVALDIVLQPFDAEGLRDAADELRETTRVAPLQSAIEDAQEILADAGVALVVLPEFECTRLSGAARWLRPDAALVQLSARYKTDDQFWFSLFHEVGHLLDRPQHDFVDDFDPGGLIPDDLVDGAEERADRYARDALIPPAAFAEFIDAGRFDAENVRSFASAAGVSPGIVVGRLQRTKTISYRHLNHLKRTVDFG
jgi:Zn-dependent peptidase ImmA (M78 family)